MTKVWLSPEGVLEDPALGERASRSDAAGAELWLLGGPLPQALTLAEGASADQIVIRIDDQPDASVWTHLGTVFDDVVPSTVTGAELLARFHNQRAGRRTKARGRMLRLLTHDLNNPLTAIRLLSDVMGQELTSEEHREDMQSILEAADAAAMLVESLGAYAKLNSPRTHARSVVDVSTVLIDVARRPSVRKNLRLAPSPGPLRVHGDAAAITQAVVDVVLTAKKLCVPSSGCDASATAEGAFVAVVVHGLVRGMPERPDLIWEEHGPGSMRDERIPVPPMGLVHARRTAEALGGQLTMEHRGDHLSLRLLLPAAVR